MQNNLKRSENFEKKQGSKRREYAFLLYPDSCVADCLGVIKQLQQPFFVILHDKDVNPDGTLKKPHYHVMILFNNPRAEGTIRQINLRCGGNGHFEPILSRRGYVRYLCHLDNPEKHKYAPESILGFYGADYSKESMSVMQRKNLDDDVFCDIIKFCKDHCIVAYCELVDYCIEHKKEWLPYLRGRNGQSIVSYIKSFYWLITNRRTDI